MKAGDLVELSAKGREYFTVYVPVDTYLDKWGIVIGCADKGCSESITVFWFAVKRAQRRNHLRAHLKHLRRN